MSHVFTVSPSPWEIGHARALVEGDRFAESHGGDLPRNGFWRDLQRRYDRDADAFAVNHHNFKLLMDHLMIERASCGVPGDGLAALVVRDETAAPVAASIPEPPSVIFWGVGLAIVYLAVGIHNRRRVLTQARDVIDWILEREGAR